MDRVRLPLFLLRIGVFIVMLMWTLDKFIHPGHAAGVFKKFYSIDGISPTMFSVIGAAELVLLVGFVTGTAKRFTYGLVLFDNLLFFAAWPMLAACITLYLLRDLDTLWAMQKT